MTFPTIAYKHTNTNVDYKLQDLLVQKFSSLEKYIGDETDVRYEVEFEKVTPQQNGNIYRVETNLWLKGNLYRAESIDENFEKATDEVRDQLAKKLRRASKKHTNRFLQGARRIKEMMRFGR
ncbi:ribosomal subunit interface protein [Candidatus Kaiserbacteria bacterium CG_4_9_14_0_2_um_filter_41_32]|uniref:Ribosomal subunit interface protein n=1 Tax=Candidatus Kaiserbacteria bacterium CG_4_9_14_0_2_um_filter_41_32 TaxID=1974601 RepID=A0A2M8FEZ1_9BACT|nr:MAG: ribosomal subunit interface protein [Candidatus Kaiserbacteria bacterium CG_4_9_14_0_2_um_filter_41_32]